MVENKALEDAILLFLEKEDAYNKGFHDVEFTQPFLKAKLVELPADMFVAEYIFAHCRIMEKRGYISYEFEKSSGQRNVGPILPAGYERLAEIHKKSDA